MATRPAPEQTEMLFDVPGPASARPPEPERTEILFEVADPRAAQDEEDGEERTQLLDLRPPREAGAAGSSGRGEANAGAAAGAVAVAAAPPPAPPPSAAPAWLPATPAGLAGPIRPSGHIVRLPMLGGAATVPAPMPAGGAWMFPAPVGPGGTPTLIHSAMATPVATSAAGAGAATPAAAGTQAKAGEAQAQAQADGGPGASGSSASGSRSSSSGPTANSSYSSVQRSKEFAPLGPAARGASYSAAPSSAEFLASLAAAEAPQKAGSKTWEPRAAQERAKQERAKRSDDSSHPRSSAFGDLNTSMSQAQGGPGSDEYSSHPRSSQFGDLNPPVSQAKGAAEQSGYSSHPRSSAFGDLDPPVSQAQGAAGPDGYSSHPRSSAFGDLNAPTSQAQVGAVPDGYSSAPRSSAFEELHTPVSQAQAGAAPDGYSSAPRSSTFGELHTPVSQAPSGTIPGAGYSSAPSSAGFGDLPPLFAVVASQPGPRPWPRAWNPTMRLHVKDVQRYREMKKAAGDDPGIRFEDKYQQIETVYTYQQIAEQHGHTKFRPLFDQALAEANGRPSPQPASDSLKYFGTTAYVDQHRRERSWIARLSEQRLRGYNPGRYDAAFGPVQTRRLEHGLAGAGRGRGAHSLLVDQGWQGFSIGEGQSEAESRRYLHDNMGRLRSAGVRTLYVEHVRHREYQELVDTWMHSPEPRLAGPLANYVDASDRPANAAGRDSLRGVFESAKANNVRIVGVDDPSAHGRSTGRFMPEERAALMNPFAEHVVRTDQARGGGKYVVLVREVHNNTIASSRGGVPGVSQLLEIPAVRVADGKLVRDPEDPALRWPSARSGASGPSSARTW